MKKWATLIEEIVWYLLLIALPFQTRHIFGYVGGTGEYAGIYCYATDALVIVLLLLWAMRSIREHHRITRDEPVHFVLLIGGIALLSALFAAAIPLGLFGWAKIVEMLALFLYVYRNIGRFSLRLTYASIFVSGVIQALIGAAQFYLQSSLQLHFLAESPLSPFNSADAVLNTPALKLLRPYGTLPHPNILAMFLIVAFFAGIGIYMKSRTFIARLGIILGMALELFVLLATLSRAELVGFALGGGIFLLFIYKEKASFMWKRFYEVAAPILFFAAIIGFALAGVMAHRAGGLAYDKSANLRASYNTWAVRIIEQKSFLGVGPRNFTHYVQTTTDPGLPAGDYQPVHNVYLLVGAELGLFGLIAFLMLLFSSVVNAAKALEMKINTPEKLDLALFFILLVILLFTMFFDHYIWTMQQGMLMFWIILGILMGLVKYGLTPSNRA